MRPIVDLFCVHVSWKREFDLVHAVLEFLRGILFLLVTLENASMSPPKKLLS